MARQTARVAGKKAYKDSRRKGLSVKDSLRAYSKAYSAIWVRSSEHQKYMRAYRKKWQESEKGKLAHRDSHSRFFLKKATQHKQLMAGGWPDAGRVEQKTGTGFVSTNQWLRAAWAQSRKIAFTLLLAPTQEAALHPEQCKFLSFGTYAKQLGMLKGWNELVKQLK